MAVIAMICPQPSMKGLSDMNILLGVIAVIAIILLITGGVGSTLHFLLWIGAILLIVAIVIFLVRLLTGRRRI